MFTFINNSTNKQMSAYGLNGFENIIQTYFIYFKFNTCNDLCCSNKFLSQTQNSLINKLQIEAILKILICRYPFKSVLCSSKPLRIREYMKRAHIVAYVLEYNENGYTLLSSR
jgi:hypothetical protein